MSTDAPFSPRPKSDKRLWTREQLEDEPHVPFLTLVDALNWHVRVYPGLIGARPVIEPLDQEASEQIRRDADTHFPSLQNIDPATIRRISPSPAFKTLLGELYDWVDGHLGIVTVGPAEFDRELRTAGTPRGVSDPRAS